MLHPDLEDSASKLRVLSEPTRLEAEGQVRTLDLGCCRLTFEP